MRYSLFCFPIFLLTPFLSGAIALSEIENNPDRYVDVSNHEIFVDVTTIDSVRYNPPYYTLEAEVYSVYPSSIVESLYVVGYNYKRSYDGIKEYVSQSYPNLTAAEKAKQLNTEIWANTGMYYSVEDQNVYNLQGDLLNTVGDNTYQQQNITFTSPAFYVGNYLFYRYYDKFFLPNERY